MFSKPLSAMALAYLLNTHHVAAAPASSFALQPVPTSDVSPGSPDFFSDHAATKIAPLVQNDDSFSFQLNLAMDLASGGGSGIMDILGAIPYIKAGDFESFATTFWALANQTRANADEIAASGATPIDARDTYFAAATYYRLADFYLHGNPSDPRLNQMWAQMLDSYDQGLARMSPISGRRLNLTTNEGFTVPAIFYSVDGTKRPTLIGGNGYDGAQEDMYHWYGKEALERGWNFISFEGPGQPTVIHEQGVGFRPDYEKAVSPVVDWLEQQPDVDCEKILLFGISMGGYMAARAAAFEPRIAALAVDGGVWNVYEGYSAPFAKSSLLDLFNAGKSQEFDAVVDRSVLQNLSLPSGTRWGIEQGLYSFKTSSPYAWLNATKEYTLEGVIDRIKMPTWVANASAENFFPGQPDQVTQALQKQGTPVHEETFGGVAGEHCQAGASIEFHRRFWLWVESVFGVVGH